MKIIKILFVIALLTICLKTDVCLAKSHSVQFRVSCVVPPRMQLAETQLSAIANASKKMDLAGKNLIGNTSNTTVNDLIFSKNKRSLTVYAR